MGKIVSIFVACSNVKQVILNIYMLYDRRDKKNITPVMILAQMYVTINYLKSHLEIF